MLSDSQHNFEQTTWIGRAVAYVLRVVKVVFAATFIVYLLGFVYFTRPWVHPASLADAVCSGNPVGVLRLLTEGADLNESNPEWPYDGLPLFLQFDNTGCQKPFANPLMDIVLHYGGADINRATASGYSVLMLVVGENNTDAVQPLLHRGANPNRQDRSGKTALMIAAEHDNKTIAKVLVAGGADTELRDNDGKTAAQIARERGFLDTANTLDNLAL